NSAGKETAPSSDFFEPEIMMESVFTSHLRWIRFEVVERRQKKLRDGRFYIWMHCRAISNIGIRFEKTLPKPGELPAAEWMFEGADLPAWAPGSQWWGAYIDASAFGYPPPPTS